MTLQLKLAALLCILGCCFIVCTTNVAPKFPEYENLSPLPESMRAIVATQEAPSTKWSEYLQVDHNHSLPRVGENQVLIRVASSSVNPVYN